MASVDRTGHGPGAAGAEPNARTTPSAKAFPIGHWTLTGDPRPCAGCGQRWIKPNARIPDGASVEQQDWLLRHAAMAERCGSCGPDAKAQNGMSFGQM